MRRLRRRTVVSAGAVCGLVLAWVLSPVLASRQTAQATVAISWPSGRRAPEPFHREFVKEAHDYARISLRSNAREPQHFQGIGFQRWDGDQMSFFITTEDRRLSETAVQETAAHMFDWTAAFPGSPKLSIVHSVWNDLPAAPEPGVAFGGIVVGLLAGLIMSSSLPHE